MNDSAVGALWKAFQSLERRLLRVENRVEFLKGQVLARLREEAETRELWTTAPIDPDGGGH